MELKLQLSEKILNRNNLSGGMDTILDGKKTKVKVEDGWLCIKLPKEEIKDYADVKFVFRYSFEEGLFLTDMKTYTSKAEEEEKPKKKEDLSIYG